MKQRRINENACRYLTDEQGNYIESWFKHFALNKDGSIKSSLLTNVLLILNNDSNFKGLFKYNESTNSIEKTDTRIIDLSKYGVGELSFNKGMLEDIDVLRFELYCENMYQGVTFGTRKIYRAVEFCTKQDLND